MDSPAESQNSSEFWGTGTCRMSGSIWKGLEESFCHPVLAMGSPLSADDNNLNTDVDLHVALTCLGTIRHFCVRDDLPDEQNVSVA